MLLRLLSFACKHQINSKRGVTTVGKVVEITKNDKVQGDASAQITLLEYGDYQCPSCAQAFVIVKKVQKHFGAELKFVFRNFPLEQHEFAEMAAETAQFASSQGKFWEVHDLLYKRQKDLSEELFLDVAEELGLDGEALAQALDEGKYTERVEEDLKSGERAGVHGTPSFFINEQPLTGSYDYDSLVEAIEKAR